MWPPTVEKPLKTYSAQLKEAQDAYSLQPNWAPEPIRWDDIPRLKLNAPQCDGFIYIFEITGGDCKAILDRMRAAKKQYKLPRIPKRDVEGNILYVGSSGINIGTLLLQHVRKTPIGTYALKIPAWYKNVPGFAARVHIRGYSKLSRPAHEILEDAIAECLEPLVGKRGGNGR